MIDLFKLLKEELGFKKLYVIYNVLFALALIGIVVVPSVLIAIIVSVPLAVVVGVIGSIFCWLVVYKKLLNEVVGYYYPEINVTSKELIFKFVAIMGLGIVFIIALLLFMFIVGVIDSIILYVLLIPLFIVGYYQLFVFFMCVYYVMLDCYINGKLGIAIVWKATFSSYKTMRKNVSRLFLKIIGFSIIIGLLSSVIVNLIGGSPFELTSSFGIDESLSSVSFNISGRFVFAQILSFIITFWSAMTVEQYVIKKYETFKNYMN